MGVGSAGGGGGEEGGRWDLLFPSPSSPHFFRFPPKCAGSQATRDVIIKFPPKYYIFPPVNSKTRNKGNQRNKVYLFFTFCVVLSDLMGFLGR